MLEWLTQYKIGLVIIAIFLWVIIFATKEGCNEWNKQRVIESKIIQKKQELELKKLNKELREFDLVNQNHYALFISLI